MNQLNQLPLDLIFLFYGLLKKIGNYEMENIGGKSQIVLTIRGIRYIIIRNLPNHLVEAITKLAASYPISLEFVVEFLRRSKENPILGHSIVIPPEVTNFFDDLNLPQDQSALWHLKLLQANLEYQNALKSLDEINARIKDEKSTLERLEAEDSKKWREYETMLSSQDQTMRQIDAIILYESSIKTVREAFGDELTFSPNVSSLPTIEFLQKQSSELKKAIAKESFTLQPARKEEVDVKKTSLSTLTKRLEENESIKEKLLKQLEKVLLNIQRIKLGLTEIA